MCSLDTIEFKVLDSRFSPSENDEECFRVTEGSPYFQICEFRDPSPTLTCEWTRMCEPERERTNMRLGREG